jgi:hypothetical protein
MNTQMQHTKLLDPAWDPKSAADHVMDGLVRITGPEVLGAHDAEFVCVGDHAFIVTTANDERPGEHPAWPFCYVTLSVVHLPTLTVEKRIPMARSEQVFANATLPVGACFVPRILRKDEWTLRCYFSSGQPGEGQQTQTWFIDFDLGKLAFSTSIHRAMLKTKAGIVPMQPKHFFNDAVAHGFKGNPSDHALYIIDSFKVHDGKTYVGINNFDSGHNALAVLNANLDTFEIVGHFTEPQGKYLTENAVNRMPDGTWMAICRQDAGDFNYAFATSKDGVHWTPAEPRAHVPNGTNSKPVFERFGGIYYLGWQEAGEGYRRIFNIDVSRDGKTWERKYRFESEKSFQYPSLHEHKGSIWMTVTQGVSDPSGKEMIMFGKLEDKDPFKPQPMKTQTPLTASQDIPASIRPDPEWSAQAIEDAKQDFTSIPYDGITPNKMVCDTTLREMPDGSWALFMLAGDDFEPSPKNFTGLTRSFDKGKTWTPLEAVPLGLPREGKTVGQGPTELMTIGNRSTLFFSTHSRTWGRDWQSWFIHSDDNCKTWSPPQPVPGRLAKFNFIRNHIVTRDGRIMLPFQHYVGPPAGTPPPPEEESPWHGEIFHYVSNPRNGVLISSDGGKTWTEHGDIRLTPDDRYYGWAENNIAELADGRIAMIIRADKSHGERAHLSEHLGGALYYAESKDGGKTWPEFAVRSDIPNPGSKATLYPLGGDTVALLHNPNPKGRYPLALWISFDGMKTWPYQRVLVEHSCDGPGHKMNYPDGFVSRDKQWLHFAYDDNRHRAVHYSAKLPPVKATRDL